MRPPVVVLDAVALREAVINAIIHNDYSYEGVPKFELFADRLEITSTGSIPQGLSEASFSKATPSPATRNSCAFTHSLPCFFLPAFGSFARIHAYRVNARKDCHHYHPP